MAGFPVNLSARWQGLPNSRILCFGHRHSGEQTPLGFQDRQHGGICAFLKAIISELLCVFAHQFTAYFFMKAATTESELHPKIRQIAGAPNVFTGEGNSMSTFSRRLPTVSVFCRIGFFAMRGC